MRVRKYFVDGRVRDEELRGIKDFQMARYWEPNLVKIEFYNSEGHLMLRLEPPTDKISGEEELGSAGVQPDKQ